MIKKRLKKTPTYYNPYTNKDFSKYIYVVVQGDQQNNKVGQESPYPSLPPSLGQGNPYPPLHMYRHRGSSVYLLITHYIKERLSMAN